MANTGRESYRQAEKRGIKSQKYHAEGTQRKRVIRFRIRRL